MYSISKGPPPTTGDWSKPYMKYLIDFTESTDRARALDNLQKFGQQTTETEIAINTLFLISTDLDKNKLSDILKCAKNILFMISW